MKIVHLEKKITLFLVHMDILRIYFNLWVYLGNVIGQTFHFKQKTHQNTKSASFHTPSYRETSFNFGQKYIISRIEYSQT